jgi:hypothetical protein
MKLHGLGDDYIMPGAYAAASSGMNAPNVDTRGLMTKVSDWWNDLTVVRAYQSAKQWTIDEAKQAVDQLYQVGLDFVSTYNELAALAPQVQSSGSPDLQQNFSDLLSRGNVLHKSISEAVASVQNISAWVKNNLGVDFGAGAPPAGLQALGAGIELIPMAIIGAVIGAIALATAWIVDARSAISKIQALQTLAESVPEEQRAAVIKQALEQTGGLGATVRSATGLLVIAGVIAAGVYFAPELKKLVKGH